MRIYICINEESLHIARHIRGDLCAVLKKYYGEINPSDIEFFEREGEISDVYVMEKALCGDDIEIQSVIVKTLKKYVKCKSINVRLNYCIFDPSFRPLTRMGVQNIEEFDYKKLSLNYHAEDPCYSFEQVILPEDIRNKILEAAAVIQVESKVFDEWGLRNIIPYAVSAISFYGAPGTGKTMAAEAVAKMLGKKIIRASYSDIESKYHGEGPKMVKAIFMAAERENAVLFIDESDSLLSKRLTDVQNSSDQAINSMRSQLLICLEQFKGIVIFATNLVVNYDKAFLSRLISIEFPLPNLEARRAIWHRHLRGDGIKIPLSNDVNIDELAEKYDFCGREIKNAVKDACVKVAMQDGSMVCQADFINSCEKIRVELESVLRASDYTQSKNDDLFGDNDECNDD